MIIPRSAGGVATRASTASKRNRPSSSHFCNPASWALAMACSTTRVDISEPMSAADVESSTAARAASFSRRHACESNPLSCSNAKRRSSPGARRAAIDAASITMVPLPQKRSASGASAAHPDKASSPAARFSFNGASPLSARQPRLNNASPDRSTYNVMVAASRYANTRTSGFARSIEGRAPVSSRNRSTIPSLMRSMANSRLCKGERDAVTSTRSVCCADIRSCHRTSWVASYRCCSLR